MNCNEIINEANEHKLNSVLKQSNKLKQENMM